MYIICRWPGPAWSRPGILCLKLEWNEFLVSAVRTNKRHANAAVMMAAFNAGD